MSENEQCNDLNSVLEFCLIKQFLISESSSNLENQVAETLRVSTCDSSSLRN